MPLNETSLPDTSITLMAEAANQKGNDFYKEGNHALALRSYLEASRLDSNEPKYTSNMSAVLYELGKYPAAISNIISAWGLHGENFRKSEDVLPVYPPNNAFFIKLATRYAKANLNGIYSRSINLHKPPSEDPDVLRSEEARQIVATQMENYVMHTPRHNDRDPKVQEMKIAWQQLLSLRTHCAGHDSTECTENIAAAEKRLRALPIFKSTPEPTMEYYIFGHDPARSLLNGISGNRHSAYILDTGDAATKKKKWSFLFGGPGDCRHVFTTLQHLADIQKRRTEKFTPKIHITLIDIHPAAVARIIVVLALLEQILRAKKEGDTDKVVLLHTTITYVYNTSLMPEYCHKLVMETAQSLLEDLPTRKHPISKFLHVDDESICALKVIFRYWSKPINKTVAKMLEATSMSGHYIDAADQLAKMMNLPKASNAKKIANKRTKRYGSYEDEQDIFEELKIILPPKALMSNHPALAKLVKGHPSLSEEDLFAKARAEIKQTWKLNPTIFDNRSTENPGLTIMGYPREVVKPFNSINTYAKAVAEFGSRRPPAYCKGSNAYDLTAQFFDLVVDAIGALEDGPTLEIMVGDLMAGTSKLIAGDLSLSRPESFPKKYTRMWLSNVPDYNHGLLSTAVFVSPYLNNNQQAGSNCLLNTASWPKMSDFSYNYTLLFPKELPKYLGCEFVWGEKDIWDDVALIRLSIPRQVHELASKKELHDWLSRLFVCILYNGDFRPMPGRIDMPTNLVGFFRLFVYLHQVGFPAHWLGDFVQLLVSDNLVTEAKPYLSDLPIKASYSRAFSSPAKVHLASWQAEFEVIIALSRLALPFSLIVSPNYPTFNDICIYTAKVKPLSRTLTMWGPPPSPFTKTIGLIFYKPRKGITGEFLAGNVLQIMEGNPLIKDSEVQIMLSQERIDLPHSEVVWKMSRQWFDRMRAEGWSMVVYRDDTRSAVTTPLSADNWHQFEDLD